MKLDRFTFGTTPAAIYLAHHLNKIDSESTSRNVTRYITKQRKIINELFAANQAGLISNETMATFATQLRNKVAETEKNMIQRGLDSLAIHLTVNIMKGDLKSMTRRAALATLANKKVVRQTKGEETGDATASFMQDSITPDILVMRSKKFLQKRNKADTLY